MNRALAIEQARASVAAQKAHCRRVYDLGGTTDLAAVLFGAWNYHGACIELRAREERLAQLEKGGE